MQKIKVGVDARLLSFNLTGIGIYILEMLTELTRMDEFEFYLYSPKPLKHNVPIDMANKIILRETNIKNILLQHIWFDYFLPRVIHKDGVDVFWGPAHRVPRLLSKSIKIIVTIHDLVWKYAPETMSYRSLLIERRRMLRAIKISNEIIVSSLSTANSIKVVYKEYLSNQPHIIYLGVSSTKQKIYEGNKNMLSAFKLVPKQYFLFVGTLEPRKNLQRLIKAYSLLDVKVRSRFKFAVVGTKGWGRQDVFELIKQYSLENHVKLLGYVDDMTLSTLYENAAFLAMPSLYEGFGLPILEALSHQTPVLTSELSSMPEVAGNAAYYVDPKNTLSIKKGLTRMLVDVALREQLVKNAKAQALKFNWAKSAQRLQRVINKMI